MQKNRLTIVSTNGSEERDEKIAPRKTNKRVEAQAKFERLWLQNPEQFNPLRDVVERERIERTWQLIKQFVTFESQQAADLGCGTGELSLRLAKQGMHVDAVDIASNALKLIQDQHVSNVSALQDFVPRTQLKDDAYDLVLSTELIGYLSQDDFRLYFSELARLIKISGQVVCSTSIDIDSEDALQRFATLADTEFTMEKWILSYHALYLKLLRFLKLPSRYATAWSDQEYRKRELEKRASIGKKWFQWNSGKVLGPLWRGFQFILSPLVQFMEQSRSTLLFFEKICRFIWSESGISHAIFIGKRRPMVTLLPPDEQPRERKQKKTVWE